MAIFTFDPAAADFDGNDDIQLSALGGQLAYLINRDAVSVTTAGGVIDSGTWRDEIGRGDELHIDLASPAIAAVEIEFKRLGAGESVTADVRDSNGTLLGRVTVPGQGSSATSRFTARIDQDDLDTPGAIASVELSRGSGSTNYVVGRISAEEGASTGDVFVFDPSAGDFDGNSAILLSAIGGELTYLANRDAVSVTDAGGVIADGTWRDEIGKNDELRIDFSPTTIASVDIEMKRLGEGESVTAEVRDSGGVLLGLVTIGGQGSSATSSFTATINQGQLDTPGQIASIALLHGSTGTNFVVGTITATTGDVAARFSLADLDGSNGFRVEGSEAGDRLGLSAAAAGDVNGDGFDDVIIGASQASPPGGAAFAGESYVIFGKAGGFDPVIDPAALDGSDGFILNGIDFDDQSGWSVAAAGDFNGDGYDDVIVGAPQGSPGGEIEAGESYLVFGHSGGFPAQMDLSALDGINGFRLDGIDGESVGFAADRSGESVASAGDVNGDGFDDIFIGARWASPGGDYAAGESYVVFGQAGGFGAAFDLANLDGSNGFRLDGISAQDLSGRSVASAGDINGDGFDDLIVGADGVNINAGSDYGESYVIFGKASGFAAAIDLSTLDGSNGFSLPGLDADDDSGRSVASAGDVNGDGFDDLIIGAPAASANGVYYSGESYVVFGKAGGFASVFDFASLDGGNGFRLDGINLMDNSGDSVASAGDVNGDGFDDVIVGARLASPGGDAGAGESYVVFGKAGGFDAAINLADLDSGSGFRLEGLDPGDYAGVSVDSAGDVNGDGFDDLIIGAIFADPSGNESAGESYVVFGRDFTGTVDFQGTDASETLTGTAAAEIMIGGLGNDTLNGNGGADSLQGGFGNDVLGIGDAGFLKVDGGGDDGLGTGDVLRLLGSDMDLDLTTIANNRVADIEIIDMDGAGANIVTLNIGDVLDSSSSTNTLTLLGDSSDAVAANFGGLGGSSASAGGFTTYTIGAAEFVVDDDIDQMLIVL